MSSDIACLKSFCWIGVQDFGNQVAAVIANEFWNRIVRIKDLLIKYVGLVVLKW